MDIDPSSITANTTVDVEETVTGLVIGDKVMANCLGDLENGIVFIGARVKTNDKLCVRLSNITASPINPSLKSWFWIKVS